MTVQDRPFTPGQQERRRHAHVGGAVKEDDLELLGVPGEQVNELWSEASDGLIRGLGLRLGIGYLNDRCQVIGVDAKGSAANTPARVVDPEESKSRVGSQHKQASVG